MQQKVKRRIVFALFVLIGIGAGIGIMPNIWQLAGQTDNHVLNNIFVDALIGAVILLVVAALTVHWILDVVTRAEKSLSSKSTSYLLFGSLSTIVGLIIATLISQLLFSRLPNGFWSTVPPVVLMIIFGT